LRPADRDEVVGETLIVREDAGDVDPEGDHAGAGQCGDVDDDVRLQPCREHRTAAYEENTRNVELVSG